MSEEKQTVCGAISKVTSAQRDAERHHIVQVSFPVSYTHLTLPTT